MIKIDLITGFLGSGKTTFLKRYAEYLLGRGHKIGILENDYGAVNIDMLLLSGLEGDNCVLEMVAGACDSDCHRRRFKTKLIALGMSGCDRVIVEPSGVFDIDEFFDVLYEPPLDHLYEIGSVIAVADADLSSELSNGADYLLASQTANAGAVVLSKTQLVSDEERESAIEHIEAALKKVKCDKNVRDIIISKDWSSLTDDDFERIMNCGYETSSFVKRGSTDSLGFGSVYIMNESFTREELLKTSKAVFADSECGNVFRIKGFSRCHDGWLEFNATSKSAEIRPSKYGQEIVIIIGENLNKDKIQSNFDRKQQIQS